MTLPGFSLLTQRLSDVLWGVLQMGVLMILAVRLGDLLAGRVAAALLLLSLNWVANLTVGNSYALGGLFVALAALAFVSIENPRLRLAATLACGVLAAGCRLSLAPFGAVLALALVARDRRPSFMAFGAALAAAFPLAVFGPFLLADAEGTFFWTVRFHLATLIRRRGAPSLAEAFALAPAVVFLAAAVFTGWRRTRASGAETENARILFVAAFATAAANLAMRAPYGGYVTPVVGVLAVVGARLALGAFAAHRGLLASGLVRGCGRRRVPARPESLGAR